VSGAAKRIRSGEVTLPEHDQRVDVTEAVPPASDAHNQKKLVRNDTGSSPMTNPLKRPRSDEPTQPAQDTRVQSAEAAALADDIHELTRNDSMPASSDKRPRMDHSPRQDQGPVQSAGTAAMQSQERPFKCAQCPLRFERVDLRHRHQVVHSRERSHKCVKCGKKFARSDGLVAHGKSASRCKGRRGTESDSDDDEDRQDDEHDEAAKSVRAEAPRPDHSTGGDTMESMQQIQSSRAPITSALASENTLMSQGRPAWLLEPLSPTQQLTPDNSYNLFEDPAWNQSPFIDPQLMREYARGYDQTDEPLTATQGVTQGQCALIYEHVPQAPPEGKTDLDSPDDVSASREGIEPLAERAPPMRILQSACFTSDALRIPSVANLAGALDDDTGELSLPSDISRLVLNGEDRYDCKGSFASTLNNAMSGRRMSGHELPSGS